MLQVRVGLFRLKSLAGGTYDALSAPETSTLKQLQVRKLCALSFCATAFDSRRCRACRTARHRAAGTCLAALITCRPSTPCAARTCRVSCNTKLQTRKVDSVKLRPC